MMTNEQYLLGKLAEEASELAQIAIKAQHFGLGETQCGQGDDFPTNAKRIEAEFNDVLGVIDLLNEECGAGIDESDLRISAKKFKTAKWRRYAAELGRVDLDGTKY